MKNVNLIIACIFMLLLPSCVTQKACLRKFPSQSDTIKITIIKDSIIFRDTTIFIRLPGEIKTDSIQIPCPPPGPLYIPKKAYAETSLAKASAWWDYPQIKLELIQKDTTIEQRLDNAIKEAYYWRSEYEKITTTPAPVKHIPVFYRFCTAGFFLIVISAVMYLVGRIKR